MSHALDILEKIRSEYDGYEEFSVSELQKVDRLREAWENSKDPEWVAFRENPKTQALYRHCVNVYRGAKITLANDDGKMPSDDRMRLHISTLWAMWFMRSLGGKPEDVQKEVEQEILRFAQAAGVQL